MAIVFGVTLIILGRLPAIIETKKLSPGEEATYTTEITPQEEGCYTIYAYLYDEAERIAYKTDVIWVKK